MFDYKGWDLHEALDALSAYDHGATDSGVRDDDMLAAVRRYIYKLDEGDRTKIIRDYILKYFLSDEKIAQRYSIEDAIEFINWFQDNF